MGRKRWKDKSVTQRIRGSEKQGEKLYFLCCSVSLFLCVKFLFFFQENTLMTTARTIPWSRYVRTFGTLLAFLLMVTFFALAKPRTFMTVGNWLNITQQ